MRALIVFAHHEPQSYNALVRDRAAALNLLLAQREAAARGTFSEDIRREMEKAAWADFLLVVCPVWWFSVPAILKGWFDRVLAAGFAYDFGRIYDKGLLHGFTK